MVRCFSANACVGYYEVEPQYHWIFYTGYPTDADWQRSWDEKFREENIEFWHQYVKKSVPRESVEDALYRVYCLNNKTGNDFFRYLIKHNDTTALQYWLSLKVTDEAAIKEVAWKQSAWYYKVGFTDDWQDPTDPSKQKMDASIFKVRELNESCIIQCENRHIRNRYVLQLMRKYFYCAEYQECVSVWDNYGENIPRSALRTQCQNYYGGALLRLKRKAEAAVTFANIGYCDINLHYDPAVLRTIYQQTPNNECFEFMLQQFVNYYFDHPKAEKAVAFNRLADEVIREGKTRNPALWKSAQAALAYINQNSEDALKMIKESEKLQGTATVKENIRLMKLLFNSTRSDNDSLYEETLYPDLKWLADKINSNLRKSYIGYFGYDETYSALYPDRSVAYQQPKLAAHYMKVFRRVIFLGAIPHFERMNQSHKVIAYLNFYNEIYNQNKRVRDFTRKGKITAETDEWGTYYKCPSLSGEQYTYYDEPHEYGKSLVVEQNDYDCRIYCLNFDYNTKLFEYIDTVNVETLLQYVAFIRSGGKTSAEKYLIRNNYKDLNYFYEIIGTKYLRKEEYAKAIPYFQKVSNKFLKTQNILEYIDAKHNPFAERWITNKSKKGKFKLSFDPAEAYAQNPGKLNFCQIMLRLNKECHSAKTEEERANAAYAYALGLYQSHVGCAWFLYNYYSENRNLSYFLEDLTEYADPQIKLWQKRVDRRLEQALSYKKDRILTLKCTMLHSQYRKKMQKTIQPKDSEYDYAYNHSVKVFKEEVQNVFCDRWKDYGKSREDWENSAWYY